MSPSIYRGRSLAWVRETLGKKGPKASSCFAMANQYKDSLVRDPNQFEQGMVVFWGDREPGNCGFYVGDGRVRCLDPHGNPCTAPLVVVAGDTVLGAMFWPTEPPKRGAPDGR